MNGYGKVLLAMYRKICNDWSERHKLVVLYNNSVRSGQVSFHRVNAGWRKRTNHRSSAVDLWSFWWYKGVTGIRNLHSRVFSCRGYSFDSDATMVEISDPSKVVSLNDNWRSKPLKLSIYYLAYTFAKHVCKSYLPVPRLRLLLMTCEPATCTNKSDSFLAFRCKTREIVGVQFDGFLCCSFLCCRSIRLRTIIPRCG